MKKFLIILCLSLVVCSLAAEDFMQPPQVAKGSYTPGMRFGMRNISRDQDPAPEYSFIPNGDGDDTTYLTSSYYDYMPFSYNGYNLRKQPDISMPYYYDAGGSYVTYMRSETSAVATDRRAYYSYVNTDGTLEQSNAANSDIYREGFTSLAIDPYTGDAFVAWHSITEPDGSYDSNMSYTLFHATGSPGSWRSPFILIDNPEVSIPFTGHYDDEFIWPQVWVGPSPEAGHRRAHAYGNQYPSSNNCLYLYADFDHIDIENSSDLDWTVQSFPFFDEIEYNGTANINKDLVVSEIDGQVVFFGSVADSLIAFYSDDYGETFTRYTQQLKQPMANPTNNQTGDYLWYNDDGMTPSEMFIVPSIDLSHYNGVFTDNNTKVQWMTGVNYNSQENIDDGEYWVAYIYPKIFTFDTETHEFSFYDIDVQDTDPADDHMAVAFDLDDDGEVDEYDIFGWPIVVMSAPSWFYDGDYQDAYFHESNCKMVANGDWLVAAWHDGAKLQNAYHEVNGYDGWIEQPEIAIIISDDGGATWSDIRYINANPNDNVIDPANHYDGNYAPELAGMLPVNISLGDKLEILSNVPGNYHAKLNFVFMDDGDYGSAIQNHGSLTNNPLRYVAIDLSFSPPLPPLNAEFSADVISDDPPLTVNFTDLTTGSIPTSWEWDFDNDGTIDSYEQNPTYVYSVEGLYTVSLTVSDGINTDTEIKVDYITVGDPLIADFAADPLTGLSPVNVQFTDLSTGEFDIILWEWDFDNDGSIDSYEQNPIYNYTNVGIYTISLTVYDNAAVDTETKIDYITVGDPLIADFEAEPLIGLAPLNVQFTDLSSGGLDLILLESKNTLRSSNAGNERMIKKDNSREIVYWEWDFDSDGTTDSYEQNPTYTFTEEGAYTVVLIVSDGTNTAFESKYEYITVGETLIAEFVAEPLAGLTPLNVQFTDLSSGGLDVIPNEEKNTLRLSKAGNERMIEQNSSREIVSWEWDFDNDGTIDSYEQNPNHTYSEEGVYTVILTVSDGTFSDIETKVNYITVGDPIIADFEAEPLEGIIPLEVQFTDLSTGGLPNLLGDTTNKNNSKIVHKENSRDIITWQWDFNNDGVIDAYNQNPIFTYTQIGIYSVTLIVSDGTYEDTITKEDYITVLGLIDANFTGNPLTGNSPLEVNFTDLSTGDPTTWLWDFDNDGFMDSNEQNPINIYDDVGVYTVSLTVSDGTNTDIEIKVDYITVTSVSGDVVLLPINTQLYPNHPNPFNPLTTISFDIKENETGILTLFNIKGQIIESQQFEPGNHSYLWDAANQTSGIYLYKLQTQTITETKKMLLLK
ncbi:MAG: PKD domain-containing protein [Candidatus Cloacimonetes bacterium]|jgi:PKD repeat protein|nr:PKD domain-containing protein [Candidatus Cloacimonadota bacterium]